MTDAGINAQRTTFYKSVLILAYVGDIDIIGKTQGAMEETSIMLEKAFTDQPRKNKHIPKTKKGCACNPSSREIYSYTFETIHNFTYLGSHVNCKMELPPR
jgi:hypothetical protein